MLELLMANTGVKPTLESLQPFIYFRYSNDYLRNLFVLNWKWSDTMGNLFEFANRNEGTEDGVRVWRSVVPFTRHNLPATPHLTLPPGQLSFSDEQAERGSGYFYMLEVFRSGYESEFTGLLTATALATRTGPGPQKLIAGGHTEGFYGTVSSNDFITGDDLANSIGLTAGTAQNSTVNWLKFNLDGKTLFVPEKTIRYNLSWNHIRDRGAVYGDTTVTIQGDTYKVRLLKGAATDPISGGNNTQDPEQSWGSEWNRLFYPLVPNPINTPTHPVSQEGIRYGEWTNYTEAQLDLGSSLDSWCQESNGTSRVRRGGTGVSRFGFSSASTVSGFYGWRPCLELVQPEDLFLGEVPASELITGSALAAATGLTQGTDINSNEPWLCFKLKDGKFVYVAKKPLRHSVTWDDLHSKGVVFGTTEVTIKGRRFKVRLLKGADTDPTPATTGWDPVGTSDSEWNRLIYNVHNGEHTRADNTTPPGHWPLYSDSDLVVHSTAGYGSYNWCQETDANNNGQRVRRGGLGVSRLVLGLSSAATVNFGWRPVLELID